MNLKDRLAGAWHESRPALLLALPFLLYLLPLSFGYQWNAINPCTPRVTGFPYDGRLPSAFFSVETYGTGTVSVPFHAHVRDCLDEGELPLWTPYQGLGQPLAAQGEGCPYSPLSLLRSCFAYSISNWITIAVYYLSSLFLYLLLRNIGLSPSSAVISGILWGLSGALTLHIGRPNFADQLAVIPLLFWACERALLQRTVARLGVLACVSALYTLAGHIQIALGPLLLIVPFCWVCMKSRIAEMGPSPWRSFLAVLIVLVLGQGLAASYLLPLAEGMRVFANKNPEGLAFLPMPYMNLVALFFPNALGHLFGTWIGVVDPALAADQTYRVNWYELFAYSGSSVLLLNLMGWRLQRGFPSHQRAMFLFFTASAVLLMLRYYGFPLVVGVNLLPIVGRQSPKHINGTIVFSLAAAAGFVVEHLRSSPLRRTRWALLAAGLGFASLLFTAIATQGGFANVNGAEGRRYLGATALLCVTLLFVLWAARRWPGLLPDRTSAAVALAFAIVGEMAVYLPLGNSGGSFLAARLVLFLLFVAAGVLFARRKYILGGTALALLALGYNALVIFPRDGLPQKLDIERLPDYMVWLKQHAGSQYRTFGIHPDYSAVGKIHDIGAIGPLAPNDYYNFLDVAAPDLGARTRLYSTFSLSYPHAEAYLKADVYFRRRAIFDWAGVRYFVLDHTFFKDGVKPGQALPLSLALAEPRADGFRFAFKDDAVTVVESLSAQPRAVFAPAVVVRKDQAAILAELKENPSAILGPPLVEEGSLDETAIATLTGAGATSDPTCVPVAIAESRRNDVRILVSANAPGLLVLKDCCCPGWHATRNGAPVDIVRVNGFARGVYLDGPGEFDIRFHYRPPSFVIGAWLAIALAAFLFLAWLDSLLRTRGTTPRWTIPAAVVGAAVVMYLCAAAYFGKPPL